jgi:hypothetical protein
MDHRLPPSPRSDGWRGARRRSRRRRHVGSLVEAVHRVGKSSDEQATGLQVFQRAAQKGGTGRPPNSCSVCIGTRMSGNRRSRANSRASATTVRRQPGGAVLERAQERRVDVERDDRRTASRSRKDDPTGAGADVEHWPPASSNELAPERKVFAVVATLEVVPEDVESYGEIAGGAGVHGPVIVSACAPRARITRTA